MERRDFIKSLAVGLLLIVKEITKPNFVVYGDGIHDDTEALNAWGRGETVYFANGKQVTDMLVGKEFLLSDTVALINRSDVAIFGCTFITSGELPIGQAVLDVRSCRGVSLSYCNFTSTRFNNYA